MSWAVPSVCGVSSSSPLDKLLYVQAPAAVPSDSLLEKEVSWLQQQVASLNVTLDTLHAHASQLEQSLQAANVQLEQQRSLTLVGMTHSEHLAKEAQWRAALQEERAVREKLERNFQEAQAEAERNFAAQVSQLKAQIQQLSQCPLSLPTHSGGPLFVRLGDYRLGSAGDYSNNLKVVQGSLLCDHFEQVVLRGHDQLRKEVEARDELVRDFYLRELKARSECFDREHQTRLQQKESAFSDARQVYLAKLHEWTTRALTAECELRKLTTTSSSHSSHNSAGESPVERRLQEVEARLRLTEQALRNTQAQSLKCALSEGSHPESCIPAQPPQPTAQVLELPSARVDEVSQAYEAKVRELENRLRESQAEVLKSTSARVDEVTLAYEAKVRELENRLRESQSEVAEANVKYAELEARLKDILAKLPTKNPARQQQQQDVVAVRQLESQLEASEDRFQAAIRAQHALECRCAVLKERLREAEGDKEAQRMYPLVGVEVCEGHCKAEAFRNLGVCVMSVRDPATSADVFPGDVVQHVEVSHAALVRDLADFRLALEKVRPGDLAHLTVLRNDARLTAHVRVEPAYADPHCLHKAPRAEIRGRVRDDNR